MFEISEIMLYLQLILKLLVIMNKDNLLLAPQEEKSKAISADIDFNMWLLEFLDRKGVICKSPWIKVDMVALFLPQDVAQL